MSDLVTNLLPPVPSSIGHINPFHLTAHYGGPSPWPGWVDRSTAEKFLASAPHSMCPEIVQSWHAYHVNSNGWLYGAYSSCTCPHGVRYEMRGRNRRTAAQGTNVGNAQSLATVYLAGDDDPLTDPAKIGYLAEAQRFGVPLDRWHSYWIATSCPGDPVRAWVQAGAPHPGGSVIPVIPPPSSEEDFVMDAEARKAFDELRKKVHNAELLSKVAVEALFPDGVNDDRGSIVQRTHDRTAACEVEARGAHVQSMAAAKALWPEGVNDKRGSLLKRIYDHLTS